jgi:hypothetical protein
MFAALITVVLALGLGPSALATPATVSCGSGDSLQKAIDQAGPGDTLAVTGRCHGTFTISKDLTLLGSNGATLDGGGSGTTLSVTAGKVALTHLSITGGAGAEGGGIRNAGTLRLVVTTVEGNSATYGGGVYNIGTLALNNSTINSNHTSSSGDFYDIGDGGAFNEGTLALRNSQVIGNYGGGLLNEGGGLLVLRNTTVDSNHSYQTGGITNEGMARILASTVSNNTDVVGGAAGIDNGGIMRIKNSTVTGNHNGNSSPGGIGNWGTLRIVSSTISENFSDDGPGGGIENDGTATIAASIIARNPFADCTGVLISDGYNIIGRLTVGSYLGCTFRAQPSDIVGMNHAVIHPRLRQLGSFGGPTMTMPPYPDSPAVNVIPVGAVSRRGLPLCPSTASTDQRGVRRPQGPGCDIGSVELRT